MPISTTWRILILRVFLVPDDDRLYKCCIYSTHFYLQKVSTTVWSKLAVLLNCIPLEKQIASESK